jgi:dTMP kinase
MQKPIFVVLEGADASGKATHSKKLAESLGAKLFSFPDYESVTGKLILGHLTNRWTALVTVKSPELKLVDQLMFQSLMLTNKMERAGEIEDLIDAGQSVVCDRYWPSAVVYGGADGLDHKWLNAIHGQLPGADLHLLLDIDPGDSVKRRPERRDRYEKQAGLMEQVIGGYRKLWVEKRKKTPKRWVVVDARGSVENTERQIRSAIDGL